MTWFQWNEHFFSSNLYLIRSIELLIFVLQNKKRKKISMYMYRILKNEEWTKMHLRIYWFAFFSQFYFFKGHAHIMSIILMVNEKFRERVPPWEVSFTWFFLFLNYEKYGVLLCKMYWYQSIFMVLSSSLIWVLKSINSKQLIWQQNWKYMNGE